ncbi:hypothetical protein D3C80_1203380 [compost metagenome]
MVQRDHVDQDAVLGACLGHDLKFTAGNHFSDSTYRNAGIGAIALDGFDWCVDLKCNL